MDTNGEPTEAYSLRTLRKRGKIKVFLGYAPGVGKTSSMLAEAHRRCSRGEDVVVGFVETHGRKETAELVEGLERLPLKHITYRGKDFEELDTAAVIARDPEWVLIDELAHTNVPGAEHEKRWQRVAEIQAAGISVITTVNVQHVESLNETVYEITGVRVQETVPDTVLDQADEVVLVDLTTAALVNRLRRGVVYDLDTVPGALASFFRRENLVALRELALRKTAEEVDDFLERIAPDADVLHPWVAEERILVCARGSSHTGSSAGGTASRGGSRAGSGCCTCARSVSGPTRDGSWTTSSRSRTLGGEVVGIEGDSVGEECCASLASGMPASSSSANRGGPGWTRSCVGRRSRASSGRSIARRPGRRRPRLA